jgi:beta-galactosidase/beta-glucuronidase
VPSQWELQGFGTYNYGQEPNKSTEHGLYCTTFKVPAAWTGRRIRLGFDGVMTDATAKVNGQSAGPVHQGGFTQFRYDVTGLVKSDVDNVLEVWSPVQIDAPVLDEKFDGTLTVHNRYDFTSLASCRVEWFGGASTVSCNPRPRPASRPRASGRDRGRRLVAVARQYHGYRNHPLLRDSADRQCA